MSLLAGVWFAVMAACNENAKSFLAAMEKLPHRTVVTKYSSWLVFTLVRSSDVPLRCRVC